MNDAPSAEPDREAADWFARLGGTHVSADTLQLFETWRRSPANALAYARVEIVWSRAGALRGDSAMDASVREALGRRSRSGVLQRPFARPAFAGLALVLVGAAVLLWNDARGRVSTGVGEVRMIALADGTQVRLNTRSRVRVRYDDDARRVLLDRGEAFFTVTADANRPFVVEAGETTVRALGTRFDVRRRQDGAQVTLVSGSVVVDGAPREGEDSARRWTLEPGQQVATASPRAQPRRVDAAAATSWTEGRLTFSATPLPSAIAEVNRYSQRSVVLEAPSLADVTVTGIFNTGDTDAFVAAAVDLFALQEDRSDPDRIVLRRSDAS